MGELTYTDIRAEWAEALQHIEHTSFPTADTEDLYWADELRALAEEFPEGGVVVLDGGRSAALGTRFSPALHCIRCGACLNVCPVYRQVGGHAYDSVYSGPIGAVLTPLLKPDDPAARALPEASSLCGACTEICPVRIPLHDLLLHLRHRDARGDASRLRRVGFWLWSQAWSRRWIFRAMVLVARAGLPLLRRMPRLPDIGWLGAWRRRRGTRIGRSAPPTPRRGRRSPSSGSKTWPESPHPTCRTATSACSAWTRAQAPPVFGASGTACSASVVLPELSGP